MTVQTEPQALPVGFGRGRRSNNIAILRCDMSTWSEIPPRIELWGPDERLSHWELCAVNGFMSGAVQPGFNLVWRFWRLGESPEEVTASLEDCDAVIVPAPYDEHMPTVNMLLDAGMPVVLAFSRSDDPRVAWVECDNRGGVSQAVSHLVRLGHRRIAFAGGPGNITDFRDREQGYLDAMAGAGLPVNEDWVTSTSVFRTAAEMKAQAARVLQSEERPTAVVCATDLLAIAVMVQIWEMGLQVPEDVAVIGFDDMPEALEVVPHLTTVRQPTVEVANHACHLAACCVVGQQPAFNTWRFGTPTTLVIRESCGAGPGVKTTATAAYDQRAVSGEVRQELEWRMRQLTAMNEEMRELLYVASHDLRAPLVTIKGFASTLRRKHGERLDEQGQQHLARIERSADSMHGLIDSLLTLSRAHSRPLNLGPVQVRDVIVRALADLKVMVAERGAKLRVCRRLPTVLADEVGLYQVFLNLLTNALRYLGEQAAPLISISHHAYPEEHEFTVRDNGIGIAPEYHEEVFQAFRRLNQVQTEGAGIGLNIVKRIISRHGGRVWVDSQLGQGAAFRFTLPRREVRHDHDGDE